MNIFTVLSQGRGRLNEENLSAMLGYLLTPSQTHGLGDTFLRLYLGVLETACGDPGRFSNVSRGGKAIRAEMLLESPYESGGRRRVVDMDLRIFARALNPTTGADEDTELHRILIENKIKPQAASDSAQLRDEYLGVLQDLDGDESVAVTMVFLTPPGESKRFAGEYDTLDAQTLGVHRKAWLRWAGRGDDSQHVAALLRRLLHQESEAESAPIAEYLRHTIKAFIRHIEESPAGRVGKVSDPRESPERGDVVQVLLVRLGDSVYQLERYESTTVRVFNIGTQKEEVAKPILRRINEEKALGVNLYRANGTTKNTRQLGREVMRELLEQNKALPRDEPA
jgi:PD-(D/E)XK nuclease superfamily